MSDRFAGEVSLVSGDDFLDEFFAPSSTDMVDGLVGQYRQARERIAAVVAQLGYVPNLVAGGLASARGKIIGMVIPNISGPIFAASILAAARWLIPDSAHQLHYLAEDAR